MPRSNSFSWKTALVQSAIMVPVDMSIREVLTLMGSRSCTMEGHDFFLAEAQWSCALVLGEDGALVGIFTERDAIRLRVEYCSLDLPIAAVMSHPLITIREAEITDLFVPLQLFQRYHIRHLPVLGADDRCIGFLTHETLRSLMQPTDLLRLRLAEEVMVSQVITAPPDTKLWTLAKIMLDYQVGSIIIADSNEAGDRFPLGLVTERDLVQLQSLTLNAPEEFDRFTVSQIMSSPLWTLTADQPLVQVQDLMDSRHISRVVITGQRGELLGIITQSTLLDALDPVALYALVESLQARTQNLEKDNKVLLQQRNALLSGQLAQKNLELQIQAQREHLLVKITERIHRSRDLEEIFRTIATEMQAYLRCDRSLIYQLDEVYNGRVVAEEVSASHLSIFNYEITDRCFQDGLAQAYEQGRVHCITDRYNTALTPCYADLLKTYKIRANLVVPILIRPVDPAGEDKPRLWGLLLAHECYQPRQWQATDIEFLQEMALQAAIALQQHEARQKIEAQVQELQQWQNRYELAERASGQMLYEYHVDTDTPIFGTNAPVILGKPIAELPKNFGEWISNIHPDDAPQFQSLAQQCIAEKTPFWVQYRYRHGQGHYIWIEDRSQWLEGQNAVVGMIADITDRKRAEEELLQIQNALSDLNQSLEARVLQAQQVELQETVTKLETTEAALLALTESQEAILSAFPDLIFQLDATGCIEDFRTHNPEYLYVPPATFLGKRFGDVLPAPIGEQLMAAFHQTQQTQRVISVEYDLTVQGQTKTFEARMVNTTNHQVIAVVREITDRKAAEGQLRQENSFRKLIVDNMTEGLCVCHAIETFPFVEFTVWNPQMEVITGYTLAEINALGWYQSLYADPVVQERAKERMAQMRQGDHLLAEEWEIRRKTGEWIMVSISTVLLPGEPQPFALALIQDISHRKAAELAIQQKQEELDRFFSVALDLLCIADRTGRFVRLNQEWENLLGYPLAELEGSQSLDYVHPDDIAATLETRQSLQNHTLISSFTNRYRCRDGSYRWLEWRVTPVGNYFYGAARDVTARREAEEANRQRAERETVLRQISQRIRDSLNLQTIFQTACQEIRAMLKCDRVGIFAFRPDSGCNWGQFVEESVAPGYRSVLDYPVEDHCFGANYAPGYLRGQFSSMNDIDDGSLQDCHRDILAQFQIRSNLVVPLIQDQTLWGLLCVHHCRDTHTWQAPEIDLVQQLAQQLSIGIQQANLYRQVQQELRIRQQAEAAMVQQLERQKGLGEIILHIRDSLNLTEILQQITQQVKDLLQCDRVIVFRLFADGRSCIVEEAVSPDFLSLKNMCWEDEIWSEEILELYWQGKPRIVPDVMRDRWTECLLEYSLQGEIKSKIVAPILQDTVASEKHRWVLDTPTGIKNKLWGILVIHACQEKRVWREEEAEILQQAANQLAIALQQSHLFERLLEQNEQLTLSNLELARATRLKDEFLANMSHELRTPLNSILGISELLQEGHYDPLNALQKNALGMIRQSSNHLLALINDILELAKIESGQVTLNLESVNLQDLCEHTLIFVRSLAIKKQIRLSLEMSNTPINLVLDSRRICQVLINLLGNAIKFTPHKGQVILRFKLEDPWVYLEVEDTGIGIASEDISTLFKPFVQIDSKLNRQYSGTGLGLALVKDIMALHQGTVSVRSEVGVGSCFTLLLPYQPTSTDPTALPALPEPPSVDESTQVHRLLLSENHEDTIATLNDYLPAQGYELTIVRHHITLQSLREILPDLVLISPTMLGTDPLDTIATLRQDPVFQHLPIIILAPPGTENDRSVYLAAGATDCVSYPLRLSLLDRLIRRLLISD